MTIDPTIITVLLTLIGGGIGYSIKSVIEKRKELLNEVTKERRILYQEYANLVVNILQNKGQLDVTKLYDIYKKYLLYASPDVIKAYSDYFQYLYNSELDNSTHILKLSKILSTMRKDLGLSNSNLGSDGEILFRAIIKDFDTVMNKKKKKTPKLPDVNS